MKQYDFEGSAIRSLRSVITTHWLSLMPASRENGWHKSKINPMTLLDYFGSLRIKPGYVLRAYECHRGPDSWGIVYAMPASTLFPDPKPNGDGRPPKPEGALDDVMMAITGDDTPYSYLCASLLAREFEQFATLSPENEWLNCFVLDGDPWFGANGVAHTLKGQGFTKDKLNWRWSGQRPSMWRPTVFMSQRSATVSFHAFSGVGRQRIIAYEDRFLRGSYTFSRHEEPVASGPAGYTW
ncbi:MAG: hypothetical protein PVH18_04070 [Chloroflexota bacterium]|jgi:hypothetical protein